MASFLDETGLTVKKMPQILEEMKADARVLLGEGIRLEGTQSLFGQQLVIFATQIALLWEALQQVNDSRNPNSADGIYQDNVCDLVGVTREDSTKTTVQASFFIASGSAVIPIGTKIRVPNGLIFSTTEEGTAIAAGPIPVNAETDEVGPGAAGVGTVTEMVTVIGGVSVSNLTAAASGKLVESNSALRLRRKQSLQIIGAGPDHAIAARIIQLDSVDQAVVVSNRKKDTDVNGIPGKAFRVVVWPLSAVSSDIFELIWETQPAGIESDGVVEGLTEDNTGKEQVVKFSYATPADIYVNAALVTADGFNAFSEIEEAVEGYFSSLKIGEAVLRYKVEASISALELEGLIDLLVTLKRDSVPAPSDTANVTMGIFEIPTLAGYTTS